MRIIVSEAFRDALRFLTSAQQEGWSEKNDEILKNHVSLLSDTRTLPPEQVNVSIVPLAQGFETVLALNAQKIGSFPFPWKEIVEGKTELGSYFVEDVIFLGKIYPHMHEYDLKKAHHLGFDGQIQAQFNLCKSLMDHHFLTPSTQIPNTITQDYPLIQSALGVALSHCSPLMLPLWDQAKKDKSFNHNEIAHALILGASNWSRWTTRYSHLRHEEFPSFNEITIDIISFIDWSKVDLTTSLKVKAKSYNDKGISPGEVTQPQVQDVMLGMKVMERVFYVLKASVLENRKHPQKPILVPQGLVSFLHEFAQSPASDNFPHQVSITHQLCWKFMMEKYPLEKRKQSIDNFLEKSVYFNALMNYPTDHHLFGLDLDQANILINKIPGAIGLLAFKSDKLRQTILAGRSHKHLMSGAQNIDETLQGVEAIKKKFEPVLPSPAKEVFVELLEEIKKDLPSLPQQGYSSSFQQEEKVLLRWTSLGLFDPQKPKVNKKKM